MGLRGGLVGDGGSKIGFGGVGCLIGETGFGGEESNTKRGTTGPEFEEIDEIDS